MEKGNKITGEDVAALLHGIHRHLNISDDRKDRIIYYEEDLLPILEVLGLPKPIWGKSLTLEEWKKERKLKES